MKEVRGVVLPSPTVFRDDGSVDEPLMRELTDWFVACGVHAFFILGSYGQGAAMNPEERKKVAEIIVQQVKHRVPVVVHAHDYRYVCPASTFYYKRSQEVCTRKAGLGCFTTTLHKHCLTPRPNFALDYYRRVHWFSQQDDKIAAVVAPSEAAAQRYREAGFEAEQTPE